MIELKIREWEELELRLTVEYGRSIILIRDRTKRELGFTPRTHHEWVPKMEGGYYRDYVCLDFYNDAQESWFRLKYL
jgi:hypothetical protein